MRLPAGLLLATWIGWGGALLGVALFAWGRTAQLRAWLESLQAAYGAGPDPPWHLHADVHLHIVVSLATALWFGLGCRLFAPRTLPWLALGLTIVVAMSDEIAQLGSAERSFEWGDQAADAVGLALAFPLLLLLRRLDVDRPRRAGR